MRCGITSRSATVDDNNDDGTLVVDAVLVTVVHDAAIIAATPNSKNVFFITDEIIFKRGLVYFSDGTSKPPV